MPFPYIILGISVILMIATAIWSYCTSLRITDRNWRELIANVRLLNREGVAIVARDFLEPHLDQIALEPEQMWELIGGELGLKCMAENAHIMLELAGFTQQWNFEEGVIVAERMRRDALALRRAVRRLKMRRSLSFLLPRSLYIREAFDLHEAISSYHLMRQRLLVLYQSSHSGIYPSLAAVL